MTTPSTAQPRNVISSAALTSSPEILAPAGNWEMMRAAVENGADAVYFGVESFNARLRANNFAVSELPEIMSWLHSRGVRGYLTLNILVFEHELGEALALIASACSAGVDAVLVQDLGIAYAATQVAPDLAIHASTQMTLSCPESVVAADTLGLQLQRVVVPRELNLRELQRFLKGCNRELETFVHGALCVAYSGQCLTSEALGGRSANRGECAQACRLPYDLIVDNQKKDLDDLRFLLSPMDLAGHGDVPKLAEMGIASLKIEGRLKTPEYVAASVQAYRQALLGPIEPLTQEKLEATFTRGFTKGYLHETDHQAVVDGRSSSKRGSFLGTVANVFGNEIEFCAAASLKAGDGIAVDSKGRLKREMGGAVFKLTVVSAADGVNAADGASAADGGRNNNSSSVTAAIGDVVRIRLHNDRVDLDEVEIGDRLWKTADPALERELRATFAGEQIRHQQPIEVLVTAHQGQPLVIELRDGMGNAARIADSLPLDEARTQPATQDSITKQVDRFGGTPFSLGSCSSDISGNPIVPASRLNNLRREAVGVLVEKRKRSLRERRLNKLSEAEIRESLLAKLSPVPTSSPKIAVLCRTLNQIQAMVEAGLETIYADFEDPKLYSTARSLVPASSKFIPATLRIIKPGESPLTEKLLESSPDAILVRNLASWQIIKAVAPSLPLYGDHTLNVANSITAALLASHGFTVLTPSYDLNGEQLTALLRTSPNTPFEITIHQHIPMFHMEHCVFCRFLSSGTDASNCGRPCEKHSVELLDRTGIAHPLKADAGCRNTVFNGMAQSGLHYLAGLQSAGISRFRIDLLNEDPAEAKKLLAVYRSAFDAKSNIDEIWSSIRAIKQLGVTKGTLDHDSLQANSALVGIRRRKPAHAQREIL